MPAEKEPYNVELGRTGLERRNVKDEFLPELRGSKANKVYKEMAMNDPIIGAILFAIRMLLLQVNWSVEPYGKESRDQEAADFLTQCMHDMSQSWDSMMRDIISFVRYGWSFLEIVYKKRRGSDAEPSSRFDDGALGWRKIALRGQDTLVNWEFDEEGGIEAMVQRAPPEREEVTIPIEKALLFRTDTTRGSPQGRSVLRNAYRPWYFKKNIEEIEGIGIERDLAGLPVVYVPERIANPGSDPKAREAREAYVNLVSNIRRDSQEGVVMPRVYDDEGNEMYRLELLSAGGKRQFDTNEIIQRYNNEIAMSVLADFILMGHEVRGSYALGVSKAELFLTSLGAWLDMIGGVFNRYGIPRLWRANGWNLRRLPRLIHEDLKPADLEALGGYLKSLAAAGLIQPDSKLESHLRNVAGLPMEQSDSIEKQLDFEEF